MKRLVVALALCLGLAACGSGPYADEDTASPPESKEWIVIVSVEPAKLGAIAVSASPVRSAPTTSSRPWLQHDLVFENRGPHAVSFGDTRTSAFLGDAKGRVLIAGDEGCGYGTLSPGAPVEAGVCAEYLDLLTIEPGASATRTITLFRGLRGMEPLTEGTYVFEKSMRFRTGREIPGEGAGEAALLRLAYEVSALKPD